MKVKSMRSAYELITQDKTYIVYGIRYNENGIAYLVQDDYYMPSYFSATFFDIVDSQLPYEEWHFGKHNANGKDFYIFGSKEMAESQAMYEQVVLHDNDGLLHFEEWRQLVNRQYENPL